MNSTSTSTTQFEKLGLRGPVLRGVEASGFEAPRPIQNKVIPPVLEGRDVIGTAPTGTGKTAAFLLPILQSLGGTRRENPRALVLAPTHELAEQITDEGRELGQHLDLVVDHVFGGTDIWDEMERLRDRVDILVACPGRLLDHIGRRTVDLSEVDVFVLDEADRMCDMGFLPDIERILSRLPRNRQHLFFSATIPQKIKQLARRKMNNPVTISVGREAPAQTISHYVCEIESNRKRTSLKKILDHLDTDSVLVFCRTRKSVRSLTKKLRADGYNACGLEGSMDSIARDATLSGFRRKSFSILVATNVAARGLDVEHISHVINYDVPEDPDVYTHRIGRTGRSGTLGDAYTLSTPGDQKAIKAIERTIDQRIERRDVPSA